MPVKIKAIAFTCQNHQNLKVIVLIEAAMFHLLPARVVKRNYLF